MFKSYLETVLWQTFSPLLLILVFQKVLRQQVGFQMHHHKQYRLQQLIEVRAEHAEIQLKGFLILF